MDLPNMRLEIVNNWQSGKPANIVVRNVPADFGQDDVWYTFKVLADRGDEIAIAGLPYLKNNFGIDVGGGTLVYLDEETYSD